MIIKHSTIFALSILAVSPLIAQSAGMNDTASTAVPAATITAKGRKLEYRLPVAKGELFGTAMGVLSDREFKVGKASQDAGTIDTEWRDPGDVSDASHNPLKKLFSVEFSVRLHLLLIPIGVDSTRLVVSGDIQWKDIQQEAQITDREKKVWPLMREVSDSIAATVVRDHH